MPRFENEGYRFNKNRDVDRTVPSNENYYGVNPVDLNFNNREDVVRDNQRRGGINPCNEQDRQSPYREQQRFRSETANDYRAHAQRRQPQQMHNEPQRRQSQQMHSEPPRKQPKQRRKRKKLSVGKAVAAVLLAAVLIVTSVFAAAINRVNYNDKMENKYVSAAELTSDKGVKNILLLGVDAREGENADETRSDTMMLVSLDSKHNTIKQTSFLRDSWVYIPSLGYSQRLNAACSSGGYNGVVEAIEYNFGIDIDGYAVVDFEMFKVLVDSLGGVEVEVSEAEAKEVTEHPGRYGDVVLDSGKYKLSGEQALAYCRIRKIDTDFVRTERQRTVMTSILSSAKHSGPIKLMNMAYKSTPYIETDLTKGEIMSMVGKAAGCLSGEFKQEKVPFEGTWEYSTIQGNSVIALNTEKNKDMLKEYIYE